jgi:ubiquinol-cytochrome c reductase cytochrome b subunit
MWKKKGLLRILNNHGVDYPSPVNVNYLWSVGCIALICLTIQIISGIFLAMHYVPHVDYAFLSVEHIMRDVNNGWMFRYIHANGASMMFIALYVHMFKHLYYGSYMRPRHLLWVSGVIIFLITILIGFLGYVLPWGQMSFWGATVITNLFSALPIIGKPIVHLLWGGYCIDNVTLNRFFCFHFILPFIIAGMVLLHLALLHKNGSNNPLGIESTFDKVSFYPYYFVKDLFALMLFILLYSFFLFIMPNYLGHPDNYIPADSIETPAHIVPEWYFLPFYAILRSMPTKGSGVLAMFGAIAVLFFLPFLNNSEIRSSTFRPIYGILFWYLVGDFLMLSWLGQAPIREPYTCMGKVATFLYFFYFFFLFGYSGKLENKMFNFTPIYSNSKIGN